MFYNATSDIGDDAAQLSYVSYNVSTDITGLEFSLKWMGASRAPTFQNLGARHKKWGPCNKFKSHCNYNFIQHNSRATNIMAVAYVAA